MQIWFNNFYLLWKLHIKTTNRTKLVQMILLDVDILSMLPLSL